MAEISAIDPIGRAWDRMQVICFRPFNLTRWLMLGFCAWLAYLGEGGFGSGINFPSGGGGTRRGGGGTTGSPFPVESENPFDQALYWINGHLVLVISIIGAFLTVGLAFYLLLHWLRARGEFMFLDGIATNRQDDLISRPWKQFAQQANSFFVYQAAMSLGNILVLMLIGMVGLWIAWPDLRSWVFGGRAIAAIVTTAIACPIAMITLGVIIACNRMFVVPIMYVRGCLFGPAWREFWKVIVPGHMGSLALLFVMYVLFVIAFSAVALVAMCCTCCIAALPYVSSVVLLPALVFLRCYSICYLEQLGAEYTILSYETPERGFEVIMPADANVPPPVPPSMPPPPSTPPAM